MDPMNATRRNVLLVQLPIPPLGPSPIRGNVPLAAAYLKQFAERSGLRRFYDIKLFPAKLANSLGDLAMVDAIASYEPWMVGFTCYLWNIERTLWVISELKKRQPGVRIVLGGPEVTFDNAWVLDSPDYDFAVVGEGEQTFAELLDGVQNGRPLEGVPGLFVPAAGKGPRSGANRPTPRSPLPDLNLVGSPYLAGILDVADEEMLLLETSRGCRYRCRFCYYWKSYDKTYYLADDTIRASLQHAQERVRAKSSCSIRRSISAKILQTSCVCLPDATPAVASLTLQNYAPRALPKRPQACSARLISPRLKSACSRSNRMRWPSWIARTTFGPSSAGCGP